MKTIGNIGDGTSDPFDSGWSSFDQGSSAFDFDAGFWRAPVPSSLLASEWGASKGAAPGASSKSSPSGGHAKPSPSPSPSPSPAPPPTPTITDPGIAADITNALAGGSSLTYSSVLTILQDAAAGGMTSSKFTSLEAFADKLNVSGGIAVASYLQQLTDDVIFGNSANASWNGGSSAATALGNLSAISTQAQAQELIGMWFLGTNLPSMNVSAIGETNYNPTYKTSTLPLYGSSGAPSYLDVNQGYLGDCYFLSSLGEVALQDPQAIENMITNNSNGTYSVRFFVNGSPDYVTVNEQLPVFGAHWANGSTLEFANGTTDNWVPLVEKAYAQLNAQSNAPHGMQLNGASDSYEGISAGNGAALTMITDQGVSATSLNPSTSSSALASIFSSVASSFNLGEDILLQTPSASQGNLVGDHMYMITGVNAASDTLTIRNPWGSSYSGSLAMTFTESIQQLAADNTSLWVTSGKAV